jgi:hypothetical protein
MWEPQPLTPLLAFTACYRDSFTLLLVLRYWESGGAKCRPHPERTCLTHLIFSNIQHLTERFSTVVKYLTYIPRDPAWIPTEAQPVNKRKISLFSVMYSGEFRDSVFKQATTASFLVNTHNSQTSVRPSILLCISEINIDIRQVKCKFVRFQKENFEII